VTYVIGFVDFHDLFMFIEGFRFVY